MNQNRFLIKVDPLDLVPKSSARIYYYAALWLTITQAAAITLLWQRIPTVVPLFFTVPWGEARLAPKMYLYLLPVLALTAIVINLVIGKLAKTESQLLSYSLATSSLIVAVMFAISLFGIMQSLL